MTALHESSLSFTAASTDITWDDGAWVTYLATVADWKERPHTLVFTTLSDNPEIRQPTEQLTVINKRTDI